jgi:hypothetical protein
MPVATENKDVLAFASENPIISSAIKNDMEVDYVDSKPSSECAKKTMTIAVDEEKTQPLQASSPSHRALIIFDWDDTLLSSSFLSSKGYRLDTVMRPCEEIDSQLKQLEQSVIALLTLALKYGHVHIVTNAEHGWVQLSAQKFMPGVVPLLSQVTVISARSTYEHMFPDSPLQWKLQAFQTRLSTVLSEKEQHIISFGDSHVEREAVRTVTRGLTNVATKSVKFAERPTADQLRRQLDLVHSCFPCIHSHKGDLDLMLTISLLY